MQKNIFLHLACKDYTIHFICQFTGCSLKALLLARAIPSLFSEHLSLELEKKPPPENKIHKYIREIIERTICSSRLYLALNVKKNGSTQKKSGF